MRLLTWQEIAERLERRLESAQEAMRQAMDALESDADVEVRRQAFNRLQDEFDDVTPLQREDEKDA